MTMMIPLRDPLLKQLQLRARTRQVSVEELVVELLNEAVEESEPFPTPEEVALKIKNTPPDPSSIRPAIGSLAEHLLRAGDDPEFDLETWTREWDRVEAEMKATTLLNRIAEENL